MRLRFFAFIVAAELALATGARSETLPLPPGLVDGESEAGAKLLFDSDARAAFLPMAMNFVTQRTQTYCGVASMVMVLNALNLPAPTTPEYAPYRIFTQENVLDGRTDLIRPRDLIARRGMTLDQFGAIVALQPVSVEVVHAADSSLDQFRARAREALAAPGRFVVVNFLRSAIGEEAYGHFSPLAAYDAAADRFLILDVARYKYPPAWVTAPELFNAMNTPDPDNAGKTRGYALITRNGG